MGNDSKMNDFLKAVSISKTYLNENKKLKVLEDISFSIGKGEILCILGASGCGKSTLLRVIGGFERIDKGEILICGNKVLKPSADMVMIFQDYNQLFPWMTVLENVLFPLKVNKIGASAMQRIEISIEYLKLVGLEDFKNYYPHQLSGGMKQRAAIARGLALKPSVLLMDEPFGSLDAITRSNLQNELLDIWRKTEVTIVFVTHDINEALALGDNIIVMDKTPGRIKERIKNFQERPRNRRSDEFLDLYEKIYSMLDVQI